MGMRQRVALPEIAPTEPPIRAQQAIHGLADGIDYLIVGLWGFINGGRQLHRQRHHATSIRASAWIGSSEPALGARRSKYQQNYGGDDGHGHKAEHPPEGRTERRRLGHGVPARLRQLLL